MFGVGGSGGAGIRRRAAGGYAISREMAARQLPSTVAGTETLTRRGFWTNRHEREEDPARQARNWRVNGINRPIGPSRRGEASTARTTAPGQARRSHPGSDGRRGNDPGKLIVDRHRLDSVTTRRVRAFDGRPADRVAGGKRLHHPRHVERAETLPPSTMPITDGRAGSARQRGDAYRGTLGQCSKVPSASRRWRLLLARSHLAEHDSAGGRRTCRKSSTTRLGDRCWTLAWVDSICAACGNSVWAACWGSDTQ